MCNEVGSEYRLFPRNLDQAKMMLAPLNLAPQTPAAVNIPTYPEFAPAEDVPWIEEEQREMLRLLDREPLVSLSRFLQRKAKESVLPASAWRPATMRKLLIDEDKAELLLHSVPKILLRGLAMGILGWQARLHPPHPLAISQPIYADDGPGTYVATMGILGRDGRGPSANEWVTVCEKIEAYIEASEVLDRTPPAQRTAAMNKLVLDARRIDRIYAHSDSGSRLAFVGHIKSASNETDKWRVLIRTLRGFRDKAPDPDKPLLQTPSYVGCARDSIVHRSSSHCPQKGYQKGNEGWWLTMSCLMDMGLVPDVHIVHAVRIWEPDQLPMSEVLMTVVARSELGSWGFNFMVPGSTTAVKVPNPARDVMGVWFHRHYLEEQLRESREGLDRAIRAVTEIPKLITEIRELQWETLSLTQRVAEAEAELTVFDEDYIENEVRLNREAIESMEMINDDLEDCLRLFDALQVEGEDEEDGGDAASS
ncbi:hypothetical protein F4818DRAFT_427394 [Hypoxylon cercidicola]|nr:hypothetical protein F4818DRAFT_427394 [Hypoxylon cercidicola]